MAIPSVISNAQQQEFKTGLRKAVSVLNSAITMNIALDGESPYDNHDLFRYLQKHMSVMKSTTGIPWTYSIYQSNGHGVHGSSNISETNAAFYTTDGMRFEFLASTNTCNASKADYGPITVNDWMVLHEGGNAHMCATTKSGEINTNYKCGSYGLNYNPNNLTATPCMLVVDVNGDRKPYPANVLSGAGGGDYLMHKYISPSPNSKKVKDMFTILVTEDRAIPFGVLAQKAMYRAQK